MIEKILYWLFVLLVIIACMLAVVFVFTTILEAGREYITETEDNLSSPHTFPHPLPCHFRETAVVVWGSDSYCVEMEESILDQQYLDWCLPKLDTLSWEDYQKCNKLKQ